MNKSERGALSVVSLLISVMALILTGIGVAVSNDKSGGGGGDGTSGSAATVDVSLREFNIGGGSISVPTGGKIRVTNAGNMEHNLSVKGTSFATANLATGGSAMLDLSSLAPGSYTVICSIPGHEASGMKANLTVGAGAGGAAAGQTSDASQPVMDNETMDRMMQEVARKFPAKTAGKGGLPLAPKVLPDGTKEFDLVAKIVDWEVEPGKIVKAWTYNGTVPGPQIKVNVGDKVKIVLKNDLPESTSLHFHGIRVPNKYDGVDPFTQDVIKPGDTWTAEFTALEPSVGMYHSHHDAQIQIPNGMAGAFLIGDMPIPAELGKVNITSKVDMFLNDAGTIGLALNGKSFPATEAYTMRVGDSMLVNYYNEGLMSHPMHMHQPTGYVIAKDGHPLKTPVPQDTILVAPGERYTVLYTAEDVGVWAWHCHILNHAETPRGMTGMVTALVVTQ